MGAALSFPQEVFGRVGHYETYAHRVVKDYGAWTLRYYAPAVAVETGGNGDEDKNFIRLAKYIGVFSTPENKAQSPVAMTTPVISEAIAMTTPVITPEPIAMTTPVISESGGGAPGTSSPMQFILPSKYRKAADAPQPTDPEVRLRDVPAKVVAVLQFGGTCRGCEAAEPQRQELLSHVAAAGLEAEDGWELHRFNPPYTIPFFRTNEVVIPVSRESLTRAGLTLEEE